MDRSSAVEEVYEELSTFARRARELGVELHPGISLVDYTQMSFIDSHEHVRAVDIVTQWGLDKSTVSRQIDQMIARGLIERTGERPGRRGQVLALTRAGKRALRVADRSVRTALIAQLRDWSDRDIAQFGDLLARFNRGD